MFSAKQAILLAVIVAPTVVAQHSIIEDLASMEVLVTEVADSCDFADSSFEEMAKVSNRAVFLSDSGDHEQAIECYLSLLEGGEPGFLIYENLSISYSKAGKCEEAEQVANSYVEWAKKDWVEFADYVAAKQGVFDRDWTDFSNRLDVETPYEEVEDPQKDRILEAFAECKAREGLTEHNKSLNTDTSDAGAG